MSSGIPTPVGYVRCAICFDLFHTSQLHRCDDGQLEDVCLRCAAREVEQVRRLRTHERDCECLVCEPIHVEGCLGGHRGDCAVSGLFGELRDLHGDTR